MSEKPLTEAQALALAHTLRRLRADAGLTQEDVAHRAGISRNHYQLLERAWSDRSKGTPANPRLSTLIAVGEALGASVARLLVDVFPTSDDAVGVELDKRRH